MKQTPPSPNSWVIIPAAGIGSRMDADRPKQYLQLAGKTVLEHTLEIFLSDPRFSSILVGIAAHDPYWATLKVSDSKLLTFTGGSDRSDTVLEGLSELESVADDDDWVWVHDAARPCLSRHDVDLVFTALEGEQMGGILAAPVADTIKRQSTTGRIESTIDRSGLWRALTPQVFRFSALKHALEKGVSERLSLTDEASAMEHAGYCPALFNGDPSNIKITYPADLLFAERQLEAKES